MPETQIGLIPRFHFLLMLSFIL